LHDVGSGLVCDDAALVLTAVHGCRSAWPEAA
jgi:hypothetical protein